MCLLAKQTSTRIEYKYYQIQTSHCQNVYQKQLCFSRETFPIHSIHQQRCPVMSCNTSEVGWFCSGSHKLSSRPNGAYIHWFQLKLPPESHGLALKAAREAQEHSSPVACNSNLPKNEPHYNEQV